MIGMTDNKDKALCLALMKNPLHFASLGFGAGLSPFAPGTIGTIVAIPIYLLMFNLPVWQYLVGVLLLFVIGIGLCEATSRALGVKDHRSIVWDEIVGYLLTMAVVPRGDDWPWTWIIAGFFLFRLFDVWKPWPVRIADQRVSGGLGVMLDDILAAVYALLTMELLRYFWEA